MRIQQLDLIAYGHLSDVHFDFTADRYRFHLIYGSNETGKSTSMSAIASWLFGMPARAVESYVHKSTDVRVGGILVDDDGSELHCIRRRGRKGTLRDGRDQDPIDEKRLAVMLGGIDQSTFQTRFGISHDELLAGGRQILEGKGELGEILFSAGAGVSQLRQIQDQITADAKGLFRTHGKSQIGERFKHLGEMRKTLSAAQVPPAEFAALCERRDWTRKQIESLRTQRQGIEKRRYQLQSAEQALPLVPKWQQATEGLSEVADAPILSDDFASRRRQCELDASVGKQLRTELEHRRETLQKQLQAIDQNLDILQHENEIDAIYHDLPIREKAEVDRLQLEDNFRRCERRMRERLRDINAAVLAEQSDPQHDELGDLVDSLRLSDSQRQKVQRLASQSEKLIGLIDDAQLDLTRLEGKLDALPDDDDHHDEASTELLIRALEEIPAPNHWIKRLNELVSRQEQLKRKCISLTDSLGLLNQNDETDDHRIAEATKCLLPDSQRVLKLAESMDQTEDAIELASTRLQETQTRIAQTSEQLALLQSDQPLPTIKDLEASRSARDEILIQCFTAIDDGGEQGLSELLSRLQKAISDADSISNQIQAHHETVHQRQSLQSLVEKLGQTANDQSCTLQTAKDRHQEKHQEWQQMWQESGFQAHSPAAMDRVVSQHQHLVQQHEEYLNACDAYRSATLEIEQCIERLDSAIRRATANTDGSDVVDLPNDETTSPIEKRLSHIHDQAVILRERAEQSSRLRRQRDQQRKQWQSELVEARSTLEERLRSLEKWQTDWQEATKLLQASQSQTSLDTGITPTDALPMLDAISDLTSQKRERDILRTRIRSIEKESEIYLARVARLAENLDKATADSELSSDQNTLIRLEKATPIIGKWHQRLQSARAVLETKTQLEQQLSKCADKLNQLNEQNVRLSTVLAQLCQEAKTTNADELPDCENRAAQRTRLASEVRDLESQLKHLAGHQSLDDFLDSLQDVKPDEMVAELTTLDQDAAQVDTQLSELQQDLGKLEHQYQAIDGSETASRLSQEIQFELGAISREIETFARIQLASDLMQKAIARYQSENQEPILRDAEGFFRTLTCDEYSQLKIDYNEKGDAELQGVRSTGTVLASQMSTGTADSLYLAMRLASLRNQMQTGKTMPLIVDDCLIQLDDQRSAAALKVFAEMSTTTQIVLFTHHRHLLELARQTLPEQQFHVHELPEYRLSP